MKNRSLWINVICFLIILTLSFVSSANYYVTDPNNCPNSYQSQTCSGSNLVCGYSGGVTFCYDNSLINAPAGSITTTGTGGTDYTCSDTTCSGGLILDCYSYDGSSPYCDTGGTALCDRNLTCYNKHVQTTCTGGSWVASSCSATCTTNYFACDGDTTDSDGCEILAGSSCGSGTGTIVNNQCYSASAGNCTSSTRLDCDNSDSDGNPITCNVGNGCEILIGGSCSVGSLSGTYGSTCSGGTGVCTVSKSYFQTGTFTEYMTGVLQNAMLWFKNFGNQNLINATGSTNKSFVVDNEANVITEGNYTGSWFKGIFNWVIGTTSTKYLSFNGTQLDLNETQLNATIDARGTAFDYTNIAMTNESNIFLENQTIEKYLNITGGILLENNATISRSGVATKTWISESGNLITQF